MKQARAICLSIVISLVTITATAKIIQRPLINPPQRPIAAAITLDNQLIAIGCAPVSDDSTQQDPALIWLFKYNEMSHVYLPHQYFPTAHIDSVRSLQFSQDGRMLVSGAQDGMICVWKKNSSGTWELHDTLRPNAGPIYSVSFDSIVPNPTLAQNNDRILTMAHRGLFIWYLLPDGHYALAQQEPSVSFNLLAAAPLKGAFVSSDAEKIQIWNADELALGKYTKREFINLGSVFRNRVRSLSCSIDGHILVVGEDKLTSKSSSDLVRVFTSSLAPFFGPFVYNQSQVLEKSKKPEVQSQAVAVSADGGKIATCVRVFVRGEIKPPLTINVYVNRNGKFVLQQTLTDSSRRHTLHSLVFSYDGTLLISCGDAVNVWEV